MTVSLSARAPLRFETSSVQLASSCRSPSCEGPSGVDAVFEVDAEQSEPHPWRRPSVSQIWWENIKNVVWWKRIWWKTIGVGNSAPGVLVPLRANYASVTSRNSSSETGQEVRLSDVDWGVEPLQSVEPQPDPEWRRQAGSKRHTAERATDVSGGVRSLLAGAASGAISRSFLAPMERVRMDILLKDSRLGAVETARRVLRLEGLKGFWRGNGLNVLRTAPFRAINFFAYDLYSRAFLKMAQSNGPGQVERFAAGACAGLTAVITCFPLDTLRTRFLAPSGSAYQGLGHLLASIITQEGIPSLYRGCLPAIMSIVPSSAVFYGVYDLLKWSHLSRLRKEKGLNRRAGLELGVWCTLAYGAFAGATSELTVYPLEVIRRQMQLQARAAVGIGAGMRSRAGVIGGLHQIWYVCQSIVRDRGVGGLYSGVGLSTMQTLPNAALSYFLYEAFLAALARPKRANGV